MPVRPPYITGDEPADRMKLGERDFTLMGFGLNQPFEPNKYNMWTNLVKRNNSNFWLYGDYGVEVDRRNIVQKVFLLTNNAYTGRGATWVITSRRSWPYMAGRTASNGGRTKKNPSTPITMTVPIRKACPWSSSCVTTSPMSMTSS